MSYGSSQRRERERRDAVAPGCSSPGATPRSRSACARRWADAAVGSRDRQGRTEGSEVQVTTATRGPRTDSGTGQQIPSVGALVAVRGRKWVVGDVEPAAGSTCVTLQSVEDGEYGRTLDVIWEVEPGRRVLPSGSLPDVAERRVRPARAAGRLPRRRALGRGHLRRRQDAAGAVPLRHHDRGLPARTGRPGRRRAAGEPADRRRRRPRQDDRGRPGRPGAAAAPPRAPHPGRLPGRADGEVARRDGGEVRPRVPVVDSAAVRPGAPRLRQRGEPVRGLPADDRQPALAARAQGAAAARRGPAARRPRRRRARLRPADRRRGAPRRPGRAAAGLRRRLAADQAHPPARAALRAPAVPVGDAAQRLPGVVHRAAGDARRPALRPRRATRTARPSSRRSSAGSSATS